MGRQVVAPILRLFEVKMSKKFIHIIEGGLYVGVFGVESEYEPPGSGDSC